MDTGEALPKLLELKGFVIDTLKKVRAGGVSDEFFWIVNSSSRTKLVVVCPVS